MRLPAFLEFVRSRLPLKGKVHIDQFAERRRRAARQIPKTAARRGTFREYWRDCALRGKNGLPRQARRVQALAQWREEKGNG